MKYNYDIDYASEPDRERLGAEVYDGLGLKDEEIEFLIRRKAHRPRFVAH